MKNTHAETILEIDLSAILHNYKALCRMAGRAKLATVVKANAYGLGIEKIAKTFDKAGCTDFFVATLDEAIELREILANAKIFVFNGIWKNQLDVFEEHKITPIINNFDQFEALTKHNNKIDYAVHIDTGMNRLGFSQRNFKQLTKDEYFKNNNPILIITHMACADNKEHELNQTQIDRFNEISKLVPNIPKSLANSHSIINLDNVEYDLVRCGGCLYGSESDKIDTLKPVISLKSRIIQTHKIDTAQTVGYGATYKIDAQRVFATVAIGYADGYLRSLSNKAFGFIDGKCVPVIGTISMDLIMLDVTETNAKVGDFIELIGENISLAQIANWAGTIEYEILTSLGSRFKRIYKD